MRQPTGAARSAGIALRPSREERDRIEQSVKTKGYETPSALIRAAIRSELHGRPELTGTEERIAGGLERVSRDVVRLARCQQAPFALLDALAKTILTCVPEPPPDARPQAIARAKERYDRLIKTAARTITGDARAALQDLSGYDAGVSRSRECRKVVEQPALSR